MSCKMMFIVRLMFFGLLGSGIAAAGSVSIVYSTEVPALQFAAGDIKQALTERGTAATLLPLSQLNFSAAAEPRPIDYEAFLAQHDMVWDRVPPRWELAPFSGNGNVGFLFYQDKNAARNVISIYVGRHDDYDHRLPYEGQQMLWIYRSRLPLGHFNLESKGDILGADLRLDLWNAELTGNIKTSQGAYAVRGVPSKNLIRERNNKGGSPERLFASIARRWRIGATTCRRLSFVSSTMASGKTTSAHRKNHAARA